jgi:hypothetical protein
MPLPEHDRVQLVWIPGHGRIAGNKIVTQLVETASEHSFVGPEPVCGTFERFAAQAIMEGVNRNHWQFTHGHKVVKGFLQGPSAKRSMELLELGRNWLSK